MKTETFKGTIASAYGKTLPTPLAFEGVYEAYETVAEIRSANDFPSDAEIVDFRNNQRKANERQKEMTATLERAGIEKPTLENDPELQLKGMVKILLASGKHTQESALATAKANLGLD